MAGLARARLMSGDVEQAKRTLDGVPKEGANDPDVQAARAAIDLAGQAQQAKGQLGDLQKRLAADANDHQARFDIAMAHYASQETEQAIEALLEIVRRKRDWNDGAARKQLVQIFEALGPKHELVSAGRRKLSAILFS